MPDFNCNWTDSGMTGTESKDVDFRLDQSWTPPSQKSNLFHLQLQTIDHWHGLWEFFLNLFHERAVCHLLKPSFSLSQLSSSSKNPYTSIHHSDHQPQKLFIKTLPSHIGKKKKKVSSTRFKEIMYYIQYIVDHHTFAFITRSWSWVGSITSFEW